MYIQDEIGNMMIDDFMVLPADVIYRNVCEPVGVAYKRHVACFYLTH